MYTYILYIENRGITISQYIAIYRCENRDLAPENTARCTFHPVYTKYLSILCGAFLDLRLDATASIDYPETFLIHSKIPNLCSTF